MQIPNVSIVHRLYIMFYLFCFLSHVYNAYTIIFTFSSLLFIYFYLCINIFYCRSKLNSRLTSLRLMLPFLYLPTQNKLIELIELSRPEGIIKHIPVTHKQ